MHTEPKSTARSRKITRAHLVGGGIASLAAAAILVRDGGILGDHVTIYEELERVGGSLDGAGDPEHGYKLRGGRMIESKDLCMFDLFSSVPSLDGKHTVTQEIAQWNEVMKTRSNARLVRHGHRVAAPRLDLSEKDIRAIEQLVLEPEALLGNDRITDHFEPSFFETSFWLMWCTTFAFQPWHSVAELRRYFVRFLHRVDGMHELRGIMRMPYNHYDSLVLPLRRWLEERGVRFQLGTRITEIEFTKHGDEQVAEVLVFDRGGERGRIPVHAHDLVIATLGSMTDASSWGSMDVPAPLDDAPSGSAWALWRQIAAERPELGRPSVFANHVAESKWMSFTTTLRSTELFDRVRVLTGNVPGEGGLITFVDSGWLMSIVLPHQPHFLDQPEGVQVFWGYALSVDRPGTFVDKPMTSCSGREIMTELLGHLGVSEHAETILADAICLPCMMPFITSQFLRREEGDRPAVHPVGYSNFAITGQFCEQPDDVVFTVEYSVRSAMTAVYELLGLDRKPPPVYKGLHDPRNVLKAFLALHDLGA